MLCLHSKHHHRPLPRPPLLSFAKSYAASFMAVASSDVAFELEDPSGRNTLEIQIDTGFPSRQQRRRARKSLGCKPGHAICFRTPHRSVSALSDTSVSCTTFNILAPIYKRLNGEGCRESQFRDAWLNRNRKILDLLLLRGTTIICLQEFWLGNEELVALYHTNLHNAGYDLYSLARTNNRGDGLLTAIRSDRLSVQDYRELLFNDCGDRVAQFFRLRSKTPMLKRGKNTGVYQELLLVNTHLLFPHNSDFCLIRLRQVYKIIECIVKYKIEHKLHRVPIILCGDWNGSKRGHVCKFLCSQGFISSYDTARQYTDSDADAYKWVSHRNHRGNICAVDFIWLLNPSSVPKLLSESWREAVFSIIKAKLKEAGLSGRDAFCFFKSHQYEEGVMLQEFKAALFQLNLTGGSSDGLTNEEIEDLMNAADTDGNGFIDYKEFQRIMSDVPIQTNGELMDFDANNCLPTSHSSFEALRSSSSCLGNREVPMRQEDSEKAVILTKQASIENMGCAERGGGTDFNVQDAFLFPPEVEQGQWPEHYSLSDHAPVTAIFTISNKGR